MTEEQKYLLKNGCDDLVINEESRPEDWIYVSDIMERWKEKKLILSGVVVPKGTLCEHDYQPDITCGVDITACTKCGDVI
jgi:hypothetical protein